MSGKPAQKVLVVDDEEPILELLKYNLEKGGYEVKTASDGMKAIEIAKRFIPDLVLLDIMMPKMDGVETCRQIKAMPEMDKTFVVFLTARSEEYSEVAAFDVGADDYITKPIKPRALMSRISALFRRDVKKTSPSTQISIGELTIDRTSYTIQKCMYKTLGSENRSFQFVRYVSNKFSAEYFKFLQFVNLFLFEFCKRKNFFIDVL